MTKIPTQTESPNGLHQRYYIQKLVHPNMFEEPGMKLKPVDENSEYFVMRLDEGGKDRNHIKACRIGIHAYANAIEPFIPELAKDLRERYPLLDESETTSPGYWQKLAEAAENVIKTFPLDINWTTETAKIHDEFYTYWQQLKSSPPQTK